MKLSAPLPPIEEKFPVPDRELDPAFREAIIENICKNQLAVLNAWKIHLDSLPLIKKQGIWKTCQSLPLTLEFYNNPSFSSSIDLWVKNPSRYVKSIAVLYSAVCFLQSEGLLPEIPSKDILAQQQQQQHQQQMQPITVVSMNSVNSAQINNTPSSSISSKKKTKPKSKSNHQSHSLQSSVSHQHQPRSHTPTQSLNSPSSKVLPLDIHIIICPKCNNALKFPPNAGIIACPVCRNEIVIRTSLHSTDANKLTLFPQLFNSQSPSLISSMNQSNFISPYSQVSFASNHLPAHTVPQLGTPQTLNFSNLSSPSVYTPISLSRLIPPSQLNPLTNSYPNNIILPDSFSTDESKH